MQLLKLIFISWKSPFAGSKILGGILPLLILSIYSAVRVIGFINESIRSFNFEPIEENSILIDSTLIL